ncbi:NIL domain-containing protein [Tolypothrix sp. PCC 7910]|uniref:NIL domain-containing protein n=1 Tax=Tolypothrix sp. PCC 7910 TaxID=2099387 RepID=UPI0014278012|nr:NIL domain-containing protein [Tolypothrix sp. PCC 7910]QIR37524.1 NIL domain-containing protein [Tolypothrix sp. PCC 7910]
MALSIVDSTLGYICIRVRLQDHTQPIISQLISRYGLTVNIAAASLKENTQDNGWFNLEIQGDSQQIAAGLTYLQSLNIDIEQLNVKSLSAQNQAKLKLLCMNPDCYGCYHTKQELQNRNQDVDITVPKNRAKFQVSIPHNYRSAPVISGLVACYGLTVNIAKADLDIDTHKDGKFDLEISGSPQQIIFGLRYLKELGLQIWL